MADFSFGILDALDSGAVILNGDQCIRHWNDWMARSSGLTARAAIGRALWQALPDGRSSRLHDAIEQALATGLPSKITSAVNGFILPLRREDGRPMHHNAVVRRLPEDGEPHCLIQVYDVTERVEAQNALRRSEDRIRAQLAEVEALYRTAPIGLGLFDRDMRFLRVNDALAAINGPSVAEHLGRTAWDIVPELRAVAEPLFRRVFETGEPILGIELHGTTPRQPDVERDWMEDFYPLKAPDGTVIAVGAIIREVTEQRRLEQRNRMLTSELHHRIKNLFTVVEAVAHQTSRTADSVPDFMQRFEGRIRALAAAQDLLAGAAGQDTVALPVVARTALAPFSDGDGRVGMDLEDLPVPSAAASDLVMVLHELATNATKYGALSVAGGRVSLTGRSEGDGPARRLSLEWRESGGPGVRQPRRKGFGTQMLDRMIVSQHGGDISRDWLDSGLVCRIRLPQRG